MWIFKKEPPAPPPPAPFYKKQPLTTIALVFTIVCTLVLGPVGVIYKGISEELKEKVDNTTLQLMIQKDREGIKRQEVENEQQERAIIENQKAIQQILIRQEVMPRLNSEAKNKIITPEDFTAYNALPDEVKGKYKEYLENKGYDTSGL